MNILEWFLFGMPWEFMVFIVIGAIVLGALSMLIDTLRK